MGTECKQASGQAASPSQQMPSADEKLRFSIIIPCHNEEQNIVPLLQEIYDSLGSRPDIEVVVVDDCSTDRTKQRLLHARNEMQMPVRVITHSRNLGQSAGLCTAVDAARGEWIVTMDGDGQNDPRDVARFIAHSEAPDFDPAITMVCGHRQKRRDTWIRRISSKIANGVRSRVLGDATPDTGCGLKLIRRDVFIALPRFNHMHRFLPALAKRSGQRVISLEVGHRPRLHGESKYGIHNRLWVGIVDLLGVMWLQRRSFKDSINEEL